MSIVSQFLKSKFWVPELNLSWFSSDAARIALRRIPLADLIAIRDILATEIGRRQWSK